MTLSRSIVTVSGHTLYEQDILPESVVVDLGANRGVFSRTISQRYGCRCYAIEASPSLYDQLEETQKLKKFHYAVWSEVGEIELNISNNPEGASALENNGCTVLERVQVPAIDMETFAQRHGVPKVDLLKVDVEGAEIPILQKVSDKFLRGITQITVEFHDFCGLVTRKQIHTVQRRLKRLGFICLIFSIRTYGNVLFLNSTRTRSTRRDRWYLRTLPYRVGLLRFLGVPAHRALESIT